MFTQGVARKSYTMSRSPLIYQRYPEWRIRGLLSPPVEFYKPTPFIILILFDMPEFD